MSLSREKRQCRWVSLRIYKLREASNICPLHRELRKKKGYYFAFVSSSLFGTSEVAASRFCPVSDVIICCHNQLSFPRGGITEDLADMITLQTVTNNSLIYISDKLEREESLMFVKHLLKVLHRDMKRSNFLAALTCRQPPSRLA